MKTRLFVSGVYVLTGLVSLFPLAGKDARAGTNMVVFTNADFELGRPGEIPSGWFVPQTLATQGFFAVLTTNRPSAGKQCVEIHWPANRAPAPDLFANLMQYSDAAPLRGKRIKVTAAIRVAPGKRKGRAQMWLRVDRPGGMGAFDNMHNRPVVSDSWKNYSITADIAEDAQNLALGLMTFDGATAWWDNLRCEVLAEARTEPPRQISDAGLTNLIALARLVGYVRHFHPSDQAASNDWLKFIVMALPQIEPAENPAQLAAGLDAAFRPIAPTVRIFESGKEPPRPAELAHPPGKAVAKITTWEHFGYTQDTTVEGPDHVYRSKRLSLKASDLATLPAYAQPTNEFRSSIGAGVTCIVPTALYADGRGTLPPPESPLPKPEPDIEVGISHRGARLATVMLTWNILQQFYPYFDVIDTDWSKQLEIALRKAATDRNEAAFYQTLNGLIVALKDGHGFLTGPGMPDEESLPIAVELVEEKLVIVAAAENVSTIHPGDVIESVDGVTARESYDRWTNRLSAATPQARKLAALRLGWGPPGSEAKLEVRGADNTLRTVALARGQLPPEPETKRPPTIHEIKPGVFYVDITRVSDKEFNKALPRLAKAAGIVFDMRGYPTGSPNWLTHLSRNPLQSAYWNIPMRHRPDNTDLTWVTSRWNLQPSNPQLTTNRVFLTDGSAISYAESVMGIVEAYHLGEIVGEPTAGTNGNIAPTVLPLGYQMIWTGMQVLKHDGTRHHGVGIIPTVKVSKTIQGIREGRDEQLERALALLK